MEDLVRGFACSRPTSRAQWSRYKRQLAPALAASAQRTPSNSNSKTRSVSAAITPNDPRLP